VAEADLANAQAALDEAIADYDADGEAPDADLVTAAAARLETAKAALTAAQAASEQLVLRAPFAGTIVDAPEQVGGMTGPGLPVYILMQLDPLVLKATIPEAARALVKPGLKVRVESVAGPTSTDDAVLRLVLPSADPQTRRVPIEVVVPNADGRFVANTLAKATLSLGAARAAIVIPATALGTTGGEHVFTVDAAATLKRVAVEVMERGTGTITVVPASPVSQVVDYPTPALVEGAKVTQR